MNPFDLRGPAFLGFYFIAAIVGLVALYRSMKPAAQLPTSDARRHLRDPYLLAYLRGGAQEVLQTVVFALSERKLLRYSGTNLAAKGGLEALRAVQHPLESAVLSYCHSSRTIEELLQDSRLIFAVENYAEPLRESGLIADGAEMSRRRPAFLVIAGALLALSVIKIYLAFQRGHSNVAFLVLLTAAAIGLAVYIYRMRRTSAGDRALRDQQVLFARLKNRVNRLAADGATNEAVMVAAAFGLVELDASAFPLAARIRRTLQKSSSSDSCSSCGSSGSSGCGGGGGCGGCGS